MAGEATVWDGVPLDDLTEKETPITYGVVKPGEEGDVPFVRGGDIAGGRVLMDQLRTIGRDVSQQYRRTLLRGGEILVSLVGNPGQIAIAPPSLAGANIARQVGLVRLKPGIDTRFVSYFLQSHDGQTALGAQSLGSVQQVINLRDLKTVKVPLPPLAAQKAIAAVLGSLDDKIELNRLMNATLEAMARALFQSWFVDFDPVRAKLAGRIPVGMDDITAALFSSTFQESSLGHVPNGWTVGNFGHVVAAARERIGDSEAVVLSAVSSSNLVRSDEHFNKQVYSKSISNYLKVRRWDFAYNPSRINIGSIGMLKESVVGAVSPVYEVFRPSATYHWFVERALAQPDVKIWIQTLCSGSVRQSLKLRDLASIPLVIPHPSVVQAFNKTWEQWHELIQKNEKESRTLATLRDTLLPKLLSGELSVAEATGNRDFQVQPGMPKP